MLTARGVPARDLSGFGREVHLRSRDAGRGFEGALGTADTACAMHSVDFES